MKKQRTKTNNPATTLITVWVPADVAKLLEQQARENDLTKSQLIRKALREKLTKQSA
jgi:hypothetical protein